MAEKKNENPLSPGQKSKVEYWSELPTEQTWPERYQKSLEKLEEARQRNQQLEKENRELRAENEILRQPQIPSWVRPNLEYKGRRKKRGPKVGHRASVRTIPSSHEVDREIKIAPEHCPRCQTGDLPQPSTWHSHTQIDLPDTQKLEVVRYHVGYSYCRKCRTLVHAPADQRQKAGMLPYSKYGPRLHALIAYWKYGVGMSLGKIQTELAQEYDLKISRGQMSEMLANTAKKLEDIYSDLRLALRRQHHLYVDETGWRNDGENFWLWSFSNEQFSYFRIEKSRGGKIVKNTLGKRYSGILISDFYSAYRKIKCSKQKCWVHLMRNSKKLEENYPENYEIQAFHRRLKYLYRKGQRLQQCFNKGDNIELGYEKILKQTRAFYSKLYEHPDLLILAKRMKRNKNALFTFIKSGIEASNNTAEREIRPAVLLRKTQFGNRTNRGAHTQEVLMSVIRTCFKQNINYLDLTAQYLTAS